VLRDEASTYNEARAHKWVVLYAVWVSISTLGDFNEEIEIELPIFSLKSSSVEIETQTA
jgi:hypothetical protein